MDMITLAMAKAYSDSQRLAYIEPQKFLTFDGNLEGKVVIDSDFGKLVKVYSQECDLANATYISRILDGAQQSLPTGAYGVAVLSDGDLSAIVINEIFYAISFSENYAESNGYDAGVYVVYHSDTTYGCGITIRETIHPIDPKYLPGVCLPVVELTTVATEEGAALTAEESARMDEVAPLGVPIIVTVPFAGIRFSSVFIRFEVDSTVIFISSDRQGDVLTISNTENGWTISVGG